LRSGKELAQTGVLEEYPLESAAEGVKRPRARDPWARPRRKRV